MMLRHTLATLAYRARTVLRGTPANFGGHTAGAGSRTAGQILAHMGDLLDWALSIAEGREKWHDSAPQSWDADVERFYAALARLDAAVAEHVPPEPTAARLFQGPIADVLTHVGQLALLRRLAGSPIQGENFFRAEIAEGRVGPDQAAPRRQF